MSKPAEYDYRTDPKTDWVLVDRVVEGCARYLDSRGERRAAAKLRASTGAIR